MHGIIHAQLKKFVEAQHGRDAWKAILDDAGLSGKLYLAKSVYADDEATAIVGAASKLTGASAAQILESFGEFLVPTLMTTYRALIRPSWKTMDMLVWTEETIHKAVRLKEPGALPPKLRFQRTGPNTLKFFYHSPRRMAAVAKGIMKGVASHFGETLDIDETPGPRGASAMTITIHPAPGGGPGPATGGRREPFGAN